MPVSFMSRLSMGDLSGAPVQIFFARRFQRFDLRAAASISRPLAAVPVRLESKPPSAGCGVYWNSIESARVCPLRDRRRGVHPHQLAHGRAELRAVQAPGAIGVQRLAARACVRRAGRVRRRRISSTKSSEQASARTG